MKTSIFIILSLFFFSLNIYSKTIELKWSDIDKFTQNRISETLFEKIMSEDFSKAKRIYHELLSNSDKEIKVKNNKIVIISDDFKEEISDNISLKNILRQSVGSNVIYSSFIEARVRRAGSYPSSVASIAGKFHSRNYLNISERYVVYRKFNYQDMDPVYDFYHIANWPVVKSFTNSDNMELTNDTNEVLIDARRLPELEVISIYKTDSKTSSVDIDSKPYLEVNSNNKNIIRITIPAGFYAVATKRYERKVNNGEKLFKRLFKGFTVQY